MGLLDLDFEARDFAKFKGAIHENSAEGSRICPALSGHSFSRSTIRAHKAKLTQ
jgi:hypothetical protein